MKRLQKMLTYCRPHGGEGERKFVQTFIRPYKPEEMKDDKGEVMAWCVRVGDALEAPVLWSGHVDTMHKSDAPVKQSIVYDEGCGMIYKDDKLMPLGADNGAGVWLLLEMIDAGVPGTYLFHRGEERGGIGSSGIATHHEEFLKQFKYAVAFDRRGTRDVITEQMCGVCCSDEFALAFAALLNTNVNMEYKPDNTGSFTDTANYIRTIPECTNVSVGYDNEHTPHETLDTWHLLELRDTLCRVFKTGIDLPVVRDPSIVADRWSGFGNFGNFGNFGDYPLCAAEVTVMPFKDIVKLVETTHPDDIAELILALAEEVERKEIAETLGSNDSQYR